MDGPRTFIWRLAVVAVVSGLLVGSTVLSIALSENPQGEYFDTASGAIHLNTIFPLYAVAFLGSAGLLLLCEFGVYWLICRCRR